MTNYQITNLSDENYFELLKQVLTDGMRRNMILGLGVLWNFGIKDPIILYFTERIGITIPECDMSELVLLE